MNESSTDYELIFGQAITGYVDYLIIELFLYTPDQFEVQALPNYTYEDCNISPDWTLSPVGNCNVPQICGDGIVSGTEKCDVPDEIDNNKDGCNASCG